MDNIQKFIQNNLNQLVSINTMDNIDNLNIALVGFIRDYDDNYMILESIDEDGILTAYGLLKISYINKIQNDDLYLVLMKKYIKIQKQQNRYYNIYNLNQPDRNFYSSGDKISIKMCLNNLFLNKELICISFEGYKNDMAYIVGLNNKYISLKEVDILDHDFEEYIDVDIDKINLIYIQYVNVILASLSLKI